MSSSLLQSAHLVVFVNGFVFGEVAAFSFDSPTPHAERRGLDSVEAYELSPTTTKAQGSMSIYRVRGGGGLEGRGIVAPSSHLPRERYFSLLVVDRSTGKRFFQADYCKVTNQAWTADARGRVMGSMTFEALQWVNEAEYTEAP